MASLASMNAEIMDSEEPAGNHPVMVFYWTKNLNSSIACLVPDGTTLGLRLQNFHKYANLLVAKSMNCKCFHYLRGIFDITFLHPENNISPLKLE